MDDPQRIAAPTADVLDAVGEASVLKRSVEALERSIFNLRVCRLVWERAHASERNCFALVLCPREVLHFRAVERARKYRVR